MRLPKYPKFRWTFRKNAIISDIESRSFLGLWQEGHIVISLTAIMSELFSDHDPVTANMLIDKISNVILHEHLHHVLYLLKIEPGHHWVIDKIITQDCRHHLCP